MLTVATGVPVMFALLFVIALGSGFADDGAVRQTAYSRRERERREHLDEQERRTAGDP